MQYVETDFIAYILVDQGVFRQTFHQFQFHFIGFSLTISLFWLVGFSHMGLLSETENPK